MRTFAEPEPCQRGLVSVIFQRDHKACETMFLEFSATIIVLKYRPIFKLAEGHNPKRNQLFKGLLSAPTQGGIFRMRLFLECRPKAKTSARDSFLERAAPKRKLPHAIYRRRFGF